MYYTIRQMAEMFGVTEHTLRFYTDEGLLPCERDGGNRGDMSRRDVPECRRPILRRLCVLCTDYDRTLYVCRPVQARTLSERSLDRSIRSRGNRNRHRYYGVYN